LLKAIFFKLKKISNKTSILSAVTVCLKGIYKVERTLKERYLALIVSLLGKEKIQYEFDDFGRLKEKISYKNGKKDGPYECYGANRRYISKGMYKDDKKNGPCNVYYNNEWRTDGGEQLMEMFTYKDGKLDGPCERYYRNGRLMEKGTFKDDKKDGLHEAYYENAQLREKCTYKDDKLDGLYESYYENGQLREKGSYINGKKNGPYVSRYTGGQLLKATYKDGHFDGPYEYFDENGLLKEKGSYINGQFHPIKDVLLNEPLDKKEQEKATYKFIGNELYTAITIRSMMEKGGR
jgi:antitoxin component YwqK of YwqJK toxin-antitoxin module